MTGEEYKTIRIMCGLSQLEASEFHGLKNRNTVRRWENGQTPVSDIAEAKIRALNDWIEERVSGIMAGMDGHEGTVVFLTYGEDDLDMILWDEDVPRQAHTAILRRAYIELIELGVDIRLVRMNRAKYRKWLGDRSDTQDRRATWAASQIR